MHLRSVLARLRPNAAALLAQQQCSYANSLARNAREGSYRVMHLSPSASFHTSRNTLYAEDADDKKSEDAPEHESAEAEKEETGAESEEAEKPMTVEEQLEGANSRIAELEAELVDQKDKVLRTFAEMENVRMITKRDVENAKNYSIQSFAKGLLDVADNLERALGSVEDGSTDEHPMLKILYEGVSMTDKELKKTFKKHGVSQFGSVGDKFDPNIHDALFQYEDANLEPGVVGQVIKTGFMFKDRTLRPAQVGTVQGPASS